MPGKMEGLIVFQDFGKDYDLAREVLDFDIINLKKYFDKKSLRAIMGKSVFLPFGYLYM